MSERREIYIYSNRGTRTCLGCGEEFDGEICPNNCHIADWECPSCGYSYHGALDVCPDCGIEVKEMTTDVECLRTQISTLVEVNKKLEELLRTASDALQARIDALEAVTQRQRNALYILEHMILANHHMQITCDDDEYFIYTDDGFFDHAEDFIGAVYKAYEAWRAKE